MKLLFALIILSLSILVTSPAFAVEQKKVCEKVKDVKTGKEKEICKTIKIHKKLEVEEKKK